MIYVSVYVVIGLAAAVYLARRNDIHKDVDSDLNVGLTSLAAASLWLPALMLRVAALFGKLTRRTQATTPPDPLLAALDELANEWEDNNATHDDHVAAVIYGACAARLRETMADNAP